MNTLIYHVNTKKLLKSISCRLDKTCLSHRMLNIKKETFYLESERFQDKIRQLEDRTLSKALFGEFPLKIFFHSIFSLTFLLYFVLCVKIKYLTKCNAGHSNRVCPNSCFITYQLLSSD